MIISLGCDSVNKNFKNGGLKNQHGATCSTSVPPSGEGKGILCSRDMRSGRENQRVRIGGGSPKDRRLVEVYVTHRVTQHGAAVGQKKTSLSGMKTERSERPPQRLVSGNIPVSFSNDEILNCMEKMGVKSRPKLMDDQAEDGRRFLYIDVPVQLYHQRQSPSGSSRHHCTTKSKRHQFTLSA